MQRAGLAWSLIPFSQAAPANNSIACAPVRRVGLLPRLKERLGFESHSVSAGSSMAERLRSPVRLDLGARKDVCGGDPPLEIVLNNQ